MKLKNPIIPLSLLITLLFVLLPCIGAQEDILKIRVSVEAKNATIPELLKEIERHPAIQFVYPHNVLPKNYRVNINVNNHELDRVLRSVLGSTNLGWQELDGMIVFYKSKEMEASANLKEDIENQVNVINIYDTVVSIQYDTVTNYIYDTLMVIQHDTVVHDVYNYKKPVEHKLTWGVAYDRDIKSTKPVSSLDYFNEYYNKTEEYNLSQSLYTLVNYKRNNLFAESGVGVRLNNKNTNYLYPEYHPLDKDTTVYLSELFETYRLEGGDTVWYWQTIWYDSVYSVVYDSTMEQHRLYQKPQVYYLTVPFSVGYRVYKKNNLSLFLQVGGQLHFRLNYKEPVNPLPNLYSSTQYKLLYYSYYAGIAGEYLVSDKISISASIYYNRQNSSRYNIPGLSEKYNSSVHVRFGLGYVIF